MSNQTGYSPVIYSQLQRMFRDCLRITNQSDFDRLRDLLNTRPCLETLSATDTKNNRTPLYQALFDELTRGNITPLNAKNYAQNLDRILHTIREGYGERALHRITNVICHSHTPKGSKRVYCETVRDLLEDEVRLGPHFTGVLDKYGLLSRAGVTEERLPFAERISAKELEEGLRPFR